EAQALAPDLTGDTEPPADGAISCYKARNCLTEMVLHAEQIELIDSGD
ncbi:primosomal replication protein N, partial [Leptospira borgpetersenii serovar Ballum]|nr:primosomal replication protein N [Leptospira borgpetersenii serovar Ballum]